MIAARRPERVYLIWWMNSSSARTGSRRLFAVEVVDRDAVGDVAVVRLLMILRQVMDLEEYFVFVAVKERDLW